MLVYQVYYIQNVLTKYCVCLSACWSVVAVDVDVDADTGFQFCPSVQKM